MAKKNEMVKELMKLSYEIATDKDAWYQDENGKWHLKDECPKLELPPECKNCGAWGLNCNDCPSNRARLDAIEKIGE